MSFAPSWFVICALGLGCASAIPRRSNCTDFLQDFHFDEGALQGIWRSVYAWPARSGAPNATDPLLGVDTDPLLGVDVVSFYPLVPDEVDSYSREMSGYFPSISWDDVRFTWNLATHRARSVKPYGYTDTLRFLLEFGGSLARPVRAVPAGETFSLALKAGSPGAPLRYQFKMVDDYLAVAACGTNSAYLLHKGMGDPEEVEMQRIVSRIDTEDVKG